MPLVVLLERSRSISIDIHASCCKRALKLCEKLGQIDTPRLTKVKGLGRECLFIVAFLLTKWYHIKSHFLVGKKKKKMVERGGLTHAQNSLPIIA